LRVALIGYGNVAKAFARLLWEKRSVYPFRIVAVHTKRHGTAYNPSGVGLEPAFSAAASTVEEFLDRSSPEVVIEVTTLDPASGEPAISHIRAALARGIHVITANKGPIAYAYADLCERARAAQVEFRFESTVMDGTPVFNLVRNTLPGVSVLGFTGVLNSTSKVVIAALARGCALEEGVREAQALGITEADPWYDLDGWDSAAKTAALANVLMDARTTPQQVTRTGLREFNVSEIVRQAREGRTVSLVSRGERTEQGVRLRVQPEILGAGELLSTATGTSNMLLLHTDLMGTIGVVSINPGVEQTAYGLFSDLVDIAKSV
jgi:homoserine dehydrogenase